MHRYISVFEEKDTWTCLILMGRNQEREKVEDIKEKENIPLN